MKAESLPPRGSFGLVTNRDACFSILGMCYCYTDVVSARMITSPYRLRALDGKWQSQDEGVVLSAEGFSWSLFINRVKTIQYFILWQGLLDRWVLWSVLTTPLGPRVKIILPCLGIKSIFGELGQPTRGLPVWADWQKFSFLLYLLFSFFIQPTVFIPYYLFFKHCVCLM